MEFWGKNRPKNGFLPTFRSNFRFFTKIPKIRQSHYQPEWCANFQGNPNLASKNAKRLFSVDQKVILSMLQPQGPSATAPGHVCFASETRMLWQQVLRGQYGLAACTLHVQVQLIVQPKISDIRYTKNSVFIKGRGEKFLVFPRFRK